MSAAAPLVPPQPGRRRAGGWRRLTRQDVPLLATIAVFGILYCVFSLAFTGFSTRRVFTNFLSDNAFLGVTAVGLTFVILAGGIDLSVGAVIGCTTIILARLIERGHVHPVIAIAAVLAGGTAFGAAMGCLIRFFSLPPFLVTLAGLFLARGAGLLVSEESIQITHPLYVRLSEMALPLGGRAALSAPAAIFLLVIVIAVCVLRYARFCRNCYALGGNEQSAVLMGLPVGSTKVAVYALSGLLSSLAGVVYTIYTSSGNALNATGLELDAIAAVVVGGTLLSGGAGSAIGTFFGVLIFGVIQTAISFQGTLNSWWTKIVIGLLLLAFILLQKLIQRKGT